MDRMARELVPVNWHPMKHDTSETTHLRIGPMINGNPLKDWNWSLYPKLTHMTLHTYYNWQKLFSVGNNMITHLSVELMCSEIPLVDWKSFPHLQELTLINCIVNGSILSKPGLRVLRLVRCNAHNVPDRRPGVEIVREDCDAPPLFHEDHWMEV